MVSSIRIPIIHKSYNKYIVFAVVGVVAFLAYEGYKKGYLRQFGLGGLPKIGPGVIPPWVATAPKVDFTLTPPQVKPNSFITLDGVFMDANNNPVTVPQATYSIYLTTNTNTPVQVAQGSLGTGGVSAFHQTISTLNFQEGEYDIVISDQPISIPANSLTGGRQPLASAGVYNRIPGSPSLVPPISSFSGPSLS